MGSAEQHSKPSKMPIKTMLQRWKKKRGRDAGQEKRERETRDAGQEKRERRDFTLAGFFFSFFFSFFPLCMCSERGRSFVVGVSAQRYLLILFVSIHLPVDVLLFDSFLTNVYSFVRERVRVAQERTHAPKKITG